MLLGYREKPSFFAVGRRLGVHHQTVQRCVERAMAYGALAALDDRPRPGKRADDHAGGQGLVGIFGLRHRPRSTAMRRNCGRHGFWPAMRGRAAGPVRAGHQCLARLAQGTVVQASRSRGNQAAQGALLSGTPRRRVRGQDGRSSVCLPRGPGPEKAAAKAEKSKKPVAIVSYDEKPGSGHRHDGTGFSRQCQAAMRASRGIMSTNAMARSACWPGIDLLTGKVHALVEERHRSREFIEFLKLLMPPIRPAPRSS